MTNNNPNDILRKVNEELDKINPEDISNLPPEQKEYVRELLKQMKVMLDRMSQDS